MKNGWMVVISDSVYVSCVVVSDSVYGACVVCDDWNISLHVLSVMNISLFQTL